MIWGYAGVYPGEFKVYKGDVTMNKLRFVADNGFGSTGLGLGELDDPARREQIVSFVQEHNLKISVHPRGVKFFETDHDVVRRQTDDFLKLLDEVGDRLNVPIVTFGVGPYHRFMADPSLDQQMDLLAKNLAPLAKGCHEMGRPLGIENHGDYYCSDLVELCKRVPHLGIFLDTGNCYLIGEKPVPACREAAPYTIGTHFKDHYVKPVPRGLTFELQGAPLGEGHVGLRQIYQDLIDLAPNPEKLIMQWEMVPPKDPPMDAWECLERSWTFIRSLPDPVATEARG